MRSYLPGAWLTIHNLFLARCTCSFQSPTNFMIWGIFFITLSTLRTYTQHHFQLQYACYIHGWCGDKWHMAMCRAEGFAHLPTSQLALLAQETWQCRSLPSLGQKLAYGMTRVQINLKRTLNRCFIHAIFWFKRSNNVNECLLHDCIFIKERIQDLKLYLT